MASLVSVNVGMPKAVDWHGKTVHTGIWKHSVHGPRMVRRLNIDGDGQGDTAGHGGEQRAVPVYQLDSYAYGKGHLGRDDFVYGQFGENLTVDGLLDDEVCIGDRYRIGEAEFEVTNPASPATASASRGQRPRNGRTLRRPHPMNPPHRRLPHLRHPAALRKGHLLPAAAGTTRRRRGAHLLLPASHRPRLGHVKPSRADAPTMPRSKMTP